MLLSDANKALRANPVIKQLLKGKIDDLLYSTHRGQPFDKEVFDALKQVAHANPILDHYCAHNDYTDHWWGEPFNPERGYSREIRLMMQELNRNAKGAVSGHTKKELLQWVNSNGSWRNISHHAQSELEWVEGIHPSQPVKLYRGLLFGKNSFREGIIERRDARIFVNALLHGHTSLMMTYKWPQSWTDDKDTADRFARKNPASSEYGAMMNWLHNGKNFIDRDLGLIISTVAKPSDILCDLGKVNLGHLNHGDEGEFIIKPEAHLEVQIEHIYTRDGEISVAHFVEFMNRLQQPKMA